MKYECYVDVCEAERITLNGNQLVAVQLDNGLARLFTADLFDSMFRPSAVSVLPEPIDEPAKEPPPVFKFKKPVARQPAAKKAAVPSIKLEATQASTDAQTSASPAQRAILRALQQRGPLTNTELLDHYEEAGFSRGAGYFTAQETRKRGLIVKRECPDTHLDKWFLTKEGAAAASV